MFLVYVQNRDGFYKLCVEFLARVFVSRELTEKPHIAGNESDVEVAMLIHSRWKELNFDRVELANYSVLLQYPGNLSRPNRLELRGSGGQVVYQASIQREKPLLPQERDPSVAPPFNAYSGTGNASVRPPASSCPLCVTHSFLKLFPLSLSLSGSGSSGVCQLW